MNYNNYFIFVHILLFSFCLCELNVGKKENLLNAFIDYYNDLPNENYTCNEGFLQSAQQLDETTYEIVASLKVADTHNVEITKSLKCTATVDEADNSVTVTSYRCQEDGQEKVPEPVSQENSRRTEVEVTEPIVERKPVRLENEVQSDTAVTSGEQFIAIPRDQPSAPCIGCASHVNPQAAGVSDLANLGVRHLDLHEPSVKHTLDTVLDVERQVQAVNGVRYILTLLINFNNCSEVQTENCASSKTCKITILTKPWVKLPNGANYRAILANNCTEEWQYGDDGEVIPEMPNQHSQSKENSSGDTDDDIQVKHNTDIQSQPKQERTLTDEELRNLQEQIIPDKDFQETSEPIRETVTMSPDIPDVSKQHVFKVESGKHNENSISVTESEKTYEQSTNINVDKKKAIDDLLDFFDFSGFSLKTEAEGATTRVRRSYDYDLQVLSLAEDFRGIKKSIENARFMYELAQTMVDYLNEMDMEIKNRAVQNVVKAEEEIENIQRFVYIQARVTIPCDKVQCEPQEGVAQICNGVIDITNENSPQVLNTFCYNENKEREYRDVIKEIALDDPVLLNLAEEALKKIESESKSRYAMKIKKIVSAITQVTTGTLTKFSLIIDNIKCNKSVPLSLRMNCTVLEQMGSKICEVIVHERHWLKERKISYSCTDRPVDMTISKAKHVSKNISVDDPKIIEMLQEAVQYLETQSNRNNKQKIVSVKSISSQIIAGFLMKIEFVVGYTNCTDENDSKDELNKCELLHNDGLRLCKAQIWDRSWIMDGRQVEVSCDDVSNSNDIEKRRKKRSIDVTRSQEPQDVNNRKLVYLKLANESLNKYLKSSSSSQHYEIIKVDRVTVKDIAGKLIKIDFSISPTNCLIQTDGSLSSSTCHIVNPKTIFHCRTKVLDKGWLDKKQYFVNCNTKVKNNLQQTNSHALKERNPNDPKYYHLAQESLIKYLKETDNSPEFKIVRIEKVSVQITSGILTSIDFKICLKKQNDCDKKYINCNSKVLEKHSLGTKDINVICDLKSNKKPSADDLVENSDNPEYMQIAVESLEKYIKDKPDSHLIRVTFVGKVIKIGKITKITFIASHTEDDDGDTVCYAEFSERTNIEVKCHLIGRTLKITEVTEDDPKYNKYVQLAEDTLYNYLQSLNSTQLYTIVNVEHVTVKWDDGIKTQINFTISPVDLDSFETLGKRCHSTIQEQPWLHKKTVDVNCELERDLYMTNKRPNVNSAQRMKRDLKPRGGKTQQDPNRPEYRKLAEESLEKYKIDAGIARPLTVKYVARVTTQVVSGTLTDIDFVASGSQESDTIRCSTKIWEQPWQNKKEIEVSCALDEQRAKRGLGTAGGETQQDPSRPEYRKLAVESLEKYKIDAGISRPLTVRYVERVNTQVVAGTLTHIDFVVSGGQESDTIRCSSKIWEQPWQNKKDIDVSCALDEHRVKRGLGTPGGETQQDPNRPEYRKLAEESLEKYKVDAGISRPLTVRYVERVTTQVVAGTLTHIDFVVSGGQESDTIRCSSKIWEQPWMNKKDIDVSCALDEQRAKRGLGTAGGETQQDPSRPEYRKLAVESLEKYKIDAGISRPLTVRYVERVTTQVVAGTLTHIDFVVSGGQESDTIRCSSKIWEQPWINKKDIDVSCALGEQRAKRGVGTAGGETQQDPSRPEYRKLAEESLEKYKINAGISRPLTVRYVERVTTQVVAGTLTHIDFVVSGGQESDTIRCSSKIWEQPWQNKKDIDVSCALDEHRVKRGLGTPGGETQQDPNRPEYRKLAEESLEKYKVDAGISRPLTVRYVERVTTQVVAGTLTHIDFVVSGGQESDTIRCSSKIWEQPWMNKKDIDVSCALDEQRAKRGLGTAGGETQQDPSRPEYRKLAVESLEKYKIDAGISRPLTVRYVERVTTQVVAGTLTHIDFVVSGGQESDTIRCSSKIWEQPWINKKDIDVSCALGEQRAKRGVGTAGGETQQDPSRPEYRKLAEESLEKYKINAGISRPLTVRYVERVTTQVVAGTLTHIDFVVSGGQESDTIRCSSKIWEQPWQNKKDIDVSCALDEHRVKRGLGTPGGETQQDPNRPEYRKLAEESLEKYKINAGISRPLTVRYVERVTTQVVAGTLTHIDFVVSGGQESDTIRCSSKIWEQPWQNKKDIDVSCALDEHRVKRGLGTPGGETQQDPNRPEYRKLAEESLEKYKVDAGISRPLTVRYVERVTSQVVAGTLTHIDFVVSGGQESDTIRCSSKIWEQPWQNKKDIDVSCALDEQRAKRGVGTAGGETQQDPSRPEYRKLAVESLEKYKMDAGISRPLTVRYIERVTTKVVAGTLTHIDFVVSGGQESDTIRCSSKIWEQPWQNKKDIDVSCALDEQRAKRGVGTAGGETQQDPSRPEYRKLAVESLEKYKIDAGISRPLTVRYIERVTTKVVAGTLTHIDFVVSGGQESDTIRCSSKIWEQPWQNKKDIDVSCALDEHRVKRGLGTPGGETQEDPSRPEYRKLAVESLEKYKIDAGISRPLTVRYIERVTTQVVAGTLTHIDFIVSGGQESDTIRCSSKIWEQPWINKKEINVSCQRENGRVKREIFQHRAMAEELNKGNKSRIGQLHVGDPRGVAEKEPDPNKREYKILAEESLRKHDQKNTVYHKVVEVNHVVIRVVSGFKYEIDFTAAPTTCSVNVSKVQAHGCKIKDDSKLYCHAEIWDRPWLKQKKIDIKCNDPNEVIEEYDADVDDSSKSTDLSNNNNEKKIIVLAEEASEKYLTTTNRKYVHKVTEIHSFSEHVADGTITNIEYSLSPTTCLRNKTIDSSVCKLKQPLIVFHCNAKLWDRPWLNIEKDIKVTCKKINKHTVKKNKRALGVRTGRQVSEDENDEIDEDTIYYYADRAVQHINDQSSSNNLHKLVSIHAVQNSIQIRTLTIQMYIEIAETYCLRHRKLNKDLKTCEEMNGLNHRLCLARLWPSPDDELIVRHVSVVCDDDDDFTSITGLNIPELLRMSIQDLERSPDTKYKLVHQGEPQVIPTLDSKFPLKINFIVATTNCSKDVNLKENPFQCYVNTEIPSRACHSFIWLKAETKFIRYINAKCTPVTRIKRSSLESANMSLDNSEIQNLVQASLQKLEMMSLHRYKQRVLQINSHSTKITSGKVTTIDFDVGYTSCLKYEWVENITSCNFLEHLPRRRCVAQIWERIWINNGKNIDVNCVDDETPLESHIEFESAEMANALAREALKHIEAKYPHPSKQKVVRIFSLEKQVVAGIHYKMKIEVGFTDCVALSDQTDCKVVNDHGLNKFCRVNVWVRPWTDHPPNFRVSCDYQEGATHDLYHHVQAEQLFYNFLATYSPSYVNDYSQMQKRFEIFKNNIKKIHELNVHEKGTALYGVTRFADLSYEEFSNTYMGLKPNLTNENQVPMKKADIPDIKIPPNFDWRDFEAVTDVKDQGACGSCWAFSVTGNIEGQWKMQSGQLVSLSEQELVDCDKLDNGCNGGLPDNAYRAIEQMGGLELESDYPYEGADEKCEFNRTLAKVQISGAVNITSNETMMAQWLVQNGPISIGINANAMQFYMGGISHPWKMLCNPTNLDHGVLVVGYGIKDYPLFHKKLPYWIVKNSWGKSWGEQGYYRVYRGDGTCGVNQMASSAVI